MPPYWPNSRMVMQQHKRHVVANLSLSHQCKFQFMNSLIFVIQNSIYSLVFHCVNTLFISSAGNKFMHLFSHIYSNGKWPRKRLSQWMRFAYYLWNGNLFPGLFQRCECEVLNPWIYTIWLPAVGRRGKVGLFAWQDNSGVFYIGRKRHLK